MLVSNVYQRPCTGTVTLAGQRCVPLTTAPLAASTCTAVGCCRVIVQWVSSWNSPDLTHDGTMLDCFFSSTIEFRSRKRGQLDRIYLWGNTFSTLPMSHSSIFLRNSLRNSSSVTLRYTLRFIVSYAIYSVKGAILFGQCGAISISLDCDGNHIFFVICQ
jgi:hypothetical protein